MGASIRNDQRSLPHLLQKVVQVDLDLPYSACLIALSQCPRLIEKIQPLIGYCGVLISPGPLRSDRAIQDFQSIVGDLVMATIA